MKYFKVFTTLIYFVNLLSTLKCQKINTTIVSQAIADIIDILSDSHAMRFEIIFANKNEVLESIAYKILRKTSNPVYVRYCTDNKIHYLHKGTPTIFLFDGNFVGEYRQVDIPISSNNTGLNARLINTYMDSAFIVYRIDSKEIIFKEKHAFSFHFQIIYLEYDENPILFNFVYHTKSSCIRSWQEVNNYSRKQMSWSSTNFIRKYDIFHNCPICVASIENDTQGISDTIFKCEKNKNGIRKFSGIGGEILNLFVRKYEAQTYQFIFGEKCDILTIPMNLETIPEYHLTPPIAYIYSTFLITHGHLYDPFEKLILPFDSFTWFALIATFMTAFILIFMTYLFSIDIQEYIFGRSVYYPSLGVLQIFFGLGFVHLPHRNVARILFIAFTIFCLVTRTGYQGKMFDFIVGDIRKPMPETIEDLFKSGIYIFGDENGNADFYELKNKTKDRSAKNNFNKYLDLQLLGKGQRNDYKYFALPYTRIKSRRGQRFNMAISRGGKQLKMDMTMKPMKENYQWHASAWMIAPFSHVYSKVEDFILRCHENGIIEYWTDILHQDKSIKEEEEPKVLTLLMLSAGFYLWLGCLGVTCCVFIGELIFFFVVKRFQFTSKKKTQCRDASRITYAKKRQKLKLRVLTKMKH